MNESTYYRRKAEAINRITKAAQALVDLLGLDPVITEGLNPPARFDSNTRHLFQLESVAGIMESVVTAEQARAAGNPETMAEGASRLKKSKAG